MAIMIGDVHGCFKTLQALLRKLPDDKIVFVGDLIDRGPRSKEVVQLVMDHPDEMISVKGNHEAWGMHCIDTYDTSMWCHPRNGGGATLRSYNPDADRSLVKYIDPEHKNFMENLPYFYEEEDLFVSHSHYDGTDWDILEKNNYQSLMWARTNPVKVTRDGKEKFHVFGHTPVPGAVVTDFYANIDTGAVFSSQESKFDGYGILTAFQWPSKKIFTQENIDFL